MDPKIKLGIIGIFTIGLILTLIFLTSKCKPHCNGAFCGPDSDDGCGGTCGCEQGGKCIKNSNGIYTCQYSNCDGIHWNDECKCDLLPCYDKTDNCQKTIQAPCDEHCLTPCSNGMCTKNICCYPQDCNNVFCGPDGCGGTCGCQKGSTCSDQGVCANSGKPGSYNIIDTTGVERTNVGSAEECAGWEPENTQLNLTAFQCNDYTDCPDGKNLHRLCKNGQDCVCVEDSSSGKKYCNRNNVYQWWYYNPSDPSGFNCTKIRQGSNVCGVDTEGSVGFDIIGNVGPTEAGTCGTMCKIEPSCPSTGKGSCCLGNLAQYKNTAQCIDSSGQTKCCVNNPDLSGYTDCMKTYPDCTKMDGAWWEGNLGEITDGVCGVKVTGPTVHVNRETLQDQSFSQPCQGKNAGDSCQYNDGTSSYTGECKDCSDGVMKCLPEQTCVRISDSSNVPGMCSSKDLCN